MELQEKLWNGEARRKARKHRENAPRTASRRRRPVASERVLAPASSPDLEHGGEPVPPVDLAAVLAAERRMHLLAVERAHDLRLLGPAVDLRAHAVGRQRLEGRRIGLERQARLLRARVRPARRVAGERDLLRGAVASLQPDRDRQLCPGRRFIRARVAAACVAGVVGLRAATDREERYECCEEDEASSSVRRASSTSASVIARLTCVHHRTVTAFQLIVMSG